QAWLSRLIDAAVEQKVGGEALVCVNAWNEWAEGAYLEPDVHFGAAYANATGRAVSSSIATGERSTLLLVGHDAFPAGAQLLLLHLGRTLRRTCGIDVTFLLLGDGALRPDYEAVGRTVVATTARALADAVADARARGIEAALVNSAASADAVTACASAGMRAVWLVHELPRVLDDRQLWSAIERAAPGAGAIVFPAECVAAGFPHLPAQRRIRPQGCYRPIERDAREAAALRQAQGIEAGARLVLGAGTGDLRKGFDLFLQAWRIACTRGDAVFCWLGEIDKELRRWLGAEIDAAVATGRLKLPGYQENTAAWFSAADAFALTSREDPYPSVVLEALSAGLPVVAFAGSGGAPELIARLDGGEVVAMGDAAAMADALLTTRRPRHAAALVRRDFAWNAYAEALVAETWPDRPSVSVAVTSCDYARYLPERLRSAFAQTYPVAGICVLDDASTDDSVAVAHDVSVAAGRDIDVIVRPRRSGSPWGQWRMAAERARSDWLWIAESDDAADPTMLAALASAVRSKPDAVLAACDSRAIDDAGATVWDDYQGYYADSGAAALAHDASFPARAFAERFLAERNLLLNVSAVLWRRDRFLAALDRCGDELASWRIAGDWRMYLEMLADQAGSVVWVARPLNAHRRHGASATGKLDVRRHHAEIARMHKMLAERLDLDAAAIARQARTRAALTGSGRARAA
ncbi:MAG: glycosyltransferase, partial [Acetobacteraceae bacterium]|nr:glycosyltransferase [Acetobacteraceae bacterium]